VTKPGDPPAGGGAPGPAAREPRGVFGGTGWSIGHVAGIELAIDHSWVLIFLLITVSLGGHFAHEHPDWGPAAAWAAALVASVLFFASILLHELGHSLTGQRLGLRVKSITLFVFGGLAQMASQPRRPRDEVLVAVAGPLVSVALGAGFLAAASAFPGASGAGGIAGAILAWLGRINLILAAFNVVPGFPLDGGRVLRGILWGVTGSFERATRIAATCGSLFAYGLMSLGAVTALFGGQIVSGLWLVFIGWFLLSAARATAGQVVIERILQRVFASDVMESVRGACLTGGENASTITAEAVLRHGLRTFYVIDLAGRLRGLLTLRELAEIPVDARPHTRIEEVMIPTSQLATIGPKETGWTAFQRMAEKNVNQLPVVQDGTLLGGLTRERLLALVQAGLALAGERRGRS
jgi:Zn-dependent protease